MENLPKLTDEQKAFIMSNYDKMNIATLTKLAFKNDKLDGRSLEAKSIKMFLAGHNKEVKAPELTKLELTEENKKFINEAIIDKTARPLELAKIIFNNPNIRTLGREHKLVYNYIKSVDPKMIDPGDELVEDKEYKPIQNIQGVAALINEYVSSSTPNKKVYDPSKLKPMEEKKCRALIGYMKSPRFTYQASSYEKRMDRTLFESEFMRLTYDKEDLTPAEVAQFISLATEIVNEAQANRILAHFQREVEEGLKSEDADRRKYSVSLAENLNAWRTKAEVSKVQQNKLLEKLEESRAERMKGKYRENSSVLSFLDLWINADTRQQLIELGKKEKTEDAEEFKRLKDMDQVMALISGQTEDEATNG